VDEKAVRNDGHVASREASIAKNVLAPRPGECPADLMRPWMANVVVTLNEGIAAADVLWPGGELLDRARRWRVRDDRAWERVSLSYRKVYPPSP